MSSETLSPTQIGPIMEAISKAVLAHRLVEIVVSNSQLAFQFPNGKVVTCLDPLTFLQHNEMLESLPSTYCTSLGDLKADTVLIGQNGQVWLTDFSHAGSAPIWQDFVSLEISFHFDLMRTVNLIDIYEFEKQLLAIDHLGDAVPAGDIDPEYRRTFNAIKTIRRLATQAAGDDPTPYYLGLFIYTVRELASYDFTIYYSKRELITWVHRLLFVSMLCEKLANREVPASDNSLATQTVGIRVDEPNHEIRVNGKKVNLTPTEFNLLLYLYRNANKLCKRQDIVRDVFEYSNANRDAERSLLNTNIERLRSKIEADPSHPQYILTIRGQGYKLVIPPALL